MLTYLYLLFFRGKGGRMKNMGVFRAEIFEEF
jgi:hypothetical protein